MPREQIVTIEGLGDPEPCIRCRPPSSNARGAVRLPHPGHDPGRQVVPRRSGLVGVPSEPRSARRWRRTPCRCTGYQKIVDAVPRRRRRMVTRQESVESPPISRRRQAAEPHRRHRQGHPKHVYASDFALPGMLFGKILRSTESRMPASCGSTSPRRGAARGARVPDGADIPQIRFGTAIRIAPCWPRARCAFVGEAIAAVAATTPGDRQAAGRGDRGRVRVPLPAVFDPEAALARRTPGPWRLARSSRRCRCSRATATSRAAPRWPAATAAGSAGSYRIYEHRFTSQHVHPWLHRATHRAVASWDGNGDVIVWSNTQLPFDMKNMLAEVLDPPASKVPCRAGHRRRLLAASSGSAWSISPPGWLARNLEAAGQGDDDQREERPTPIRASPRWSPEDRRAATGCCWRARAGCHRLRAPMPTPDRRPRRSRYRCPAGPYRSPNLLLGGSRSTPAKVRPARSVPAGPDGQHNFAVECRST